MSYEQETVRFGLYTVDLRSGELRKGRDAIPLQNLPFRVLALLLREPGRVVSREELRQELWPADTFVDFERGISTAVRKLREALGDSATNPRFIETVGRRGYRFIAPVSTVEVQAGSQPSAVAAGPALALEPAPALPTLIEKKKPLLALQRGRFLMVLVVVLAAVVLAFDWISRVREPKVLRMARLTYTAKAEHVGGLHSDGSRIYFMQRNGARWTLMQTSLSGGEATPAPLPFPNASIVDISPDHSEMLITTVVEFLGKYPLWIMPAQGGTPRRVGDLAVDSAAWFPDGKRILCSVDGDVFSVDRNGTDRHSLFHVPSVHEFAWRPDGSSFRFTVFDPYKPSSTIWEASASGANPHPVMPGWNVPGAECCGVWTPDGKNYIFRSVQNQQEDLWVLHEPEGWFAGNPKPMRLTNGPTSFSEPLVSPDGKTLFALGIQAESVVQRFDERQNTFVPTVFPPFSFDIGFSRDGQWVAYIGAGMSLWRSRIDGSERLQLTPNGMYALRPHWSDDGKRILFIGGPPLQYHAGYIVPKDGGALESVLKDDSVDRAWAEWSPDGESVLLGAQPGMYPNEGIAQVNLRTHEVSEFPGSKGLRSPRWSPARNYLAARSEDEGEIHLYDTNSRTWNRVITVHQVTRIEWERDGSYLYYQDIRDPGQSVFRLNPKTGKTERVLDFTPLIKAGAMRCGFEGRTLDGSFLVSVRSGWADLYAFDVELPK